MEEAEETASSAARVKELEEDKAFLLKVLKPVLGRARELNQILEWRRTSNSKQQADMVKFDKELDRAALALEDLKLAKEVEIIEANRPQ